MRSPPPPPPRKYAPIPPKMAPEDESGRQNNDQIHQSSNRKLNPPPKQTKLNLGKKIGLSFAGIAVFLQVVVIAFLVLNRRQLLKTESGSSKPSNGNTEFVTLD
nr:proline-rich receptor-like protein kinase PERK2 [Ipomoea batatas]